jgi:hypothetical protein
MAAATIGLATAPAFADSYSGYVGGSYGAGTEVSDQGCTVIMDSIHDDTTNKWLSRAAYISDGSNCNGFFHWKSASGATGTYDDRAFNSTSFERTGWHWDGPGGWTQACVGLNGDVEVCTKWM